jgi:hypothetical protein
MGGELKMLWNILQGTCYRYVVEHLPEDVLPLCCGTSSRGRATVMLWNIFQRTCYRYVVEHPPGDVLPLCCETSSRGRALVMYLDNEINR